MMVPTAAAGTSTGGAPGQKLGARAGGEGESRVWSTRGVWLSQGALSQGASRCDGGKSRSCFAPTCRSLLLGIACPRRDPCKSRSCLPPTCRSLVFGIACPRRDPRKSRSCLPHHLNSLVLRMVLGIACPRRDPRKSRSCLTADLSWRAFSGACRSRPTLYRAEYQPPVGRVIRSSALEPSRGIVRLLHMYCPSSTIKL